MRRLLACDAFGCSCGIVGPAHDVACAVLRLASGPSSDLDREMICAPGAWFGGPVVAEAVAGQGDITAGPSAAPPRLMKVCSPVLRGASLVGPSCSATRRPRVVTSSVCARPLHSCSSPPLSVAIHDDLERSSMGEACHLSGSCWHAASPNECQAQWNCDAQEVDHGHN